LPPFIGNENSQNLYPPNRQGKGVGKQLIEKIAEIGRQNGDQTLSLNVFRRNPPLNFIKSWDSK